MDRELRIIIVEADPRDAARIEGALEQANTRFAWRRVEALEKLRTELEDFSPDAVVSSYNLPGFSALDVITLLKKRAAPVPVIVVSEAIGEQLAVECIKQGAKDFILKSGLDRLADAIVDAAGTPRATLENHEHEDRLRGSESLYRLIVENTYDVTSILDYEGRFLYVSRSIAGVLGYSAEELVGTDSFALVHPEDRSALVKNFHRGSPGQIGRTAVVRYRHKNGSWRAVESARTWIVEDDGEPAKAVIFSRDITDRGLIEEALRESEERFRTAFSSAPNGTALVGFDGWILQANHYLAEILGYSEQELLTKTLQELASAEHYTQIEEGLRQLLSGELQLFQTEQKCLHKLGNELVMLLRVKLVHDSRGNPIYFVAHLQDITERTRTEEALREREGIFRSLAESVSANIFICRGTRYVYVNSAAVSQTGFSRDELLSMDLSELVHPDYVEEVTARTIARQRGEDAASRFELKIKTKSGEDRWWDATAAMIVFQGQPAVLVTAFDVTKRKRAEEALRESEERYRQFVELCPDAIFVHTEGKLVFVNSAALRMVEASSPDEVIGRPALDFVHPDYRELVRDRIQRMNGEGDRVPLLEEKFVALDGSEKYGEVAAMPFTYAGKRAVQVVVRDISERRQAEQLRDKYLRVQSALGQSGKALLSTLSLESLLTNVLEAAKQAVPAAEKGTIMLWDEVSESLLVRAASGYDATIDQTAFSLDRGYVARAARSRRPLIINDAHSDAELRYEGENPEILAIRSAVVAPLIGRDRLLGVVSLDSTRESGFSDDDLTLLVAFAGQAGMAIENARLYEQMRESEQRYRALFERNLAGVYRTRLDGSYVDCNDSFARILGYESREEIMSRPAPEVYFDIQDRERFLKDLQETGSAANLEFRLKRKDGREVWTLENVALVTTDGSDAGIIEGTMIDITERKRAEDALRKSEERYRSVVDTAHDMIFTLSTDGRITSINPAFDVTTGWSAADWIGKDFKPLFHPDDLSKAVNAVEQVLKNPNAPNAFESRIVTRSGNDRVVEFGLTPLVENETVIGALGIARDVTERRRAEEELRASEERFSKAFNNSPNAMLIATFGERRFIAVNETFLRDTGYTRQDVIGRTVDELSMVEPEDFETLQKILVENGRVFNLEVRSRTREGEQRVLLVSAERIVLGPDECLLLNANDITNRKSAEEALRKNEEQLRLALEAAQMGIWDWNLLTGQIKWSDDIGPMFGLPRGSFDGGTDRFRELVHPEDWPAVNRAVQLALETGRGQDVELRTVWADGTTHWIAGRGEPFYDRNGTPMRMIGVSIDITERKRAEEEQARLQAAVRQSAREWRLTFDAIESPILILDRDGQIMRLNRAARELADATYQRVLGQPVASIGDGEPWQIAAQLVQPVREARRTISAQAKDDASGSCWDIAVSVLGGKDSSDERVIVVARDVTATVRLQDSLRKSETMSAMGRLVAGVAHEVRNPLFGISATLDAFEARFGVGEDQRYMSVLRGELDRLSELMRELLDYGKPAALEIAEFRFHEIVAQAVRSCGNLAKKNFVEILDRVRDDLVSVLVDRRRMLQVLENLIQNAVQHSTQGGVVTVDATEVKEDGRCWVECVIRDSGPGFRNEDLGKVFEPFFTRRTGGTGLGLSIVQRIVEEHEGNVLAANHPDGGAMLVTRIPAVAIPEESQDQPLEQVERSI